MRTHANEFARINKMEDKNMKKELLLAKIKDFDNVDEIVEAMAENLVNQIYGDNEFLPKEKPSPPNQPSQKPNTNKFKQ